MLDLDLIRRNPDLVREALQKRHDDPALVEAVLALDVQRREMLQTVETLRAERNRVSKEIGRMKEPAERAARIAEMRAVSSAVSR